MLSHIVLSLVIGASLGFMGGVFGIGGGIIAVPLLVLGFGLDQPLAQGTALVLMAPNLLVGWWRYSRLYPVPLPRALGIGLAHRGIRSAPVYTALTPGNARARSVRIEMMRACAMGLRRKVAKHWPRICKSLVKQPCPRTSASSSS